jgi:hypothetical protein
MKNKERMGLAALVLGATFVVSGCSILEQAVASEFKHETILHGSNGAIADCITVTDPPRKLGKGQVTIIFDNASCSDITPGARASIGISSEPFSGSVTVPLGEVYMGDFKVINPQNQP